jgi:cytochrome d ubiquinol oxidase subunit II
MDLQTTWFLLVFVLLIGYAILDGFDLGVGVLHLTGKGDTERRVGLNAIGPVWDGNEVWLITGGGALFAAFPYVYATVFSAMYLALMLVLAALIIRAVSIEFRSKVESPAWRSFWDGAFCVGSLLPAVLFGVAFGNILRGLPIAEVQGRLFFTGGFLGLLNPYALFIGVLTLSLFTAHGAIYLAGKSEGSQQERCRRQAMSLWLLTLILYIVATAWTFAIRPGYLDAATGRPLFWILLLLLLAGLFATPAFIFTHRFFPAILASSAAILGMMGIAAVSIYPALVPSLNGRLYDLTIGNSSSTPRTLRTMLMIALAGMPLVLLYTVVIYRVFKGKVRVGHDSY